MAFYVIINITQGDNMKQLITALNDQIIKGKRVQTLAELLYNKNGRLRTSNLHHIEAAYKLRKYTDVSIKRVDYSNDYIISL